MGSLIIRHPTDDLVQHTPAERDSGMRESHGQQAASVRELAGDRQHPYHLPALPNPFKTSMATLHHREDAFPPTHHVFKILCFILQALKQGYTYKSALSPTNSGIAEQSFKHKSPLITFIVPRQSSA